MPDVVPAANITLLTGHGSTGKTTLGLQLAGAVALGRGWLNHMPEHGAVMVVCCEDDEEELHRRLACIARHFGAPLGAFRDRFHIVSLAGHEAVLATPEGRSVMRPTPLFEQIKLAAITFRPKLIMIDNAADVFAGNENERSLVRQFVTLLRSLAIESGAGTNDAPSEPHRHSSGSGMSGSTAWFNSARAQLFLKTVSTEKDEEADSDLRELEARKNNYGPLTRKMLLRWRDGVFLVEPGARGLDKLAFEQQAEAVFLTMLEQFERQGRNVSPNPGRSYAPTLFATEPEAMGINAAALKRAMAHLLSANKIHVRKSGPPSRQRSHLATGANS